MKPLSRKTIETAVNSKSPLATTSWDDVPNDVSIRAKSFTFIERGPTLEIAPHAAYRQQLFNAFLHQLVPKTQTEMAGPRSWLALVPEVSMPTKALEVSTMALCMVSLGRRNENPLLVQQSLGLYGQALHEMQKALWDPQLMRKDETLAACLSLSMYELLGCPDSNRRAYGCHQDGLAKLVELRGPGAHTSVFGHQLFLAFRTQNVGRNHLVRDPSNGKSLQILYALERHQSTFLSTQIWLSKPWETVSKTFLDQIFDLCSLAPGIFEEADKLDGFPAHDSLHKMLKMINSCWKIDADLERVLFELEASTAGPLYWPERSVGLGPIEDEELAKVFPVALHFSDLKMAYTVMFYWAIALILWSGLCRLYQAVQQIDLNCLEIDCSCLSCDQKTPNNNSSTDTHLHKFDLSKLPPLGHRANFPSIARNICQSVEYCMQESMGQFGAFSAAAPLSIALETLKNVPGCSGETAWAKAAMGKIVRRGLRLLKY